MLCFIVLILVYIKRFFCYEVKIFVFLVSVKLIVFVIFWGGWFYFWKILSNWEFVDWMEKFFMIMKFVVLRGFFYIGGILMFKRWILV